MKKKEGGNHDIEIKSLGNKEKDSNKFSFNDSWNKNDNCLVSLGENISDLVKYDLINQCDYYILIGQCGRVDLSTLQKFLEKVDGNKSKCLAFFLIT